MHNDSSPTYRLLRLSDALKLTGLGRTIFLGKVRCGEIAAPVRLTVRSVAWRESDLIAWIESRPTVQPRGKAA